VQPLGHIAYPGGNMFSHGIVNTQKGDGVCKGGVCVTHCYMGMSRKCGRVMSMNASRGMLFLAGTSSPFELNVGAL
jgi:hypothetical protein